jgi:hypothetical protein
VKGPLIAPKHFSEHSPESWHSFVKSLKIEPEKKTETPIKFKLTKKGKPSVTLPRSRKPAWILMSELESLARSHDCPISEVYNTLTKKEVLIIKDRKEIPK